MRAVPSSGTVATLIALGAKGMPLKGGETKICTDARTTTIILNNPVLLEKQAVLFDGWPETHEQIHELHEATET